MLLELEENQKDFVASNAQSMLEAVYEKNLYTLGIYNNDDMVGFLLYD